VVSERSRTAPTWATEIYTNLKNQNVFLNLGLLIVKMPHLRRSVQNVKTTFYKDDTPTALKQ